MKINPRNSIIVAALCLPFIGADAALLAGGTLPLLQALLPFALTFAVAIGLLVFLRRRDGQKVEADERTARIDGRSHRVSWFLTLYVLLLLMANDRLGLLRISAVQCLFLAVAVLLTSFWASRIVLNRAGDPSE